MCKKKVSHLPSAQCVSLWKTSYQKLEKVSGKKVQMKLKRHNNHKKSCKMFYRSWKKKSIHLKEEFMCIIHNMMDHYKTAIPRLEVKKKMMVGLGSLPITLMEMIVHGHGDEAYTQYSSELWPNDPNFTIGSLLHLLRTLEKELVRESRKSRRGILEWVLFTLNVKEILMHEGIESPRTICWCKTSTTKIVASNGQ